MQQRGQGGDHRSVAALTMSAGSVPRICQCCRRRRRRQRRRHAPRPALFKVSPITAAPVPEPYGDVYRHWTTGVLTRVSAGAQAGQAQGGDPQELANRRLSRRSLTSCQKSSRSCCARCWQSTPATSGRHAAWWTRRARPCRSPLSARKEGGPRCFARCWRRPQSSLFPS